MSETLVNTIDGDKLYAERAVKDASGNSISETYATKSEIPVVDQSYDATSTNAQSGVAVAEALSNVPSSLSAGDGIDITSDVVSAKVDGSTISFNASGELQATVSGGVTDVTVDGTSVVNAQGVAEITMPTFTQVQSDWSQSDNTQVDYIKNKPSLATVATTGAYSDLLGTPSLATVATSGDYDDLTNKPTIPAAQVQSNWNQSDNTQVDFIKNKPSLAAVATSGAYSDLSGTPTINNVPSVTSSDDNKVLKASYSGGVGSYSWENESGDTVTDVQVNGSSVVSGGVASITVPTVDQTYNASSTNAQSGTAVASAVSSAISGINQVPSSTALDSSKVLTVNSSGNAVWDNPPTEIFYVTYNSTTFGQVKEAYDAGKLPVLKYSGVLLPMCRYESVSSGTSYAEFRLLAVTDPNTANIAVGYRRYVVRSTDGGASTWNTDNWDVAPADWNATTGATRILNKPSIPAAQVNSDWNASSGVAEILNKPNLATVATSGDYDDLTNKPSIPAAQVNSDWNASSGVAEILNKPTLATVATTGAYSDLSGTPTIPAAQVNSDWNASSGVAEILNKPTLATVATSGSYNDLSDKPTIPVMELFEAVYGTTTYADITAAIVAKKIVYCRVSPSGATRMAFLAYIGSNTVEFQYYRSLSSRSATNQLDEVYVYTVTSSGWTTTTRKAGVLIAAGTGLTSSYASGTVTINGKETDQTYDATSANPQSGVAVAGAIVSNGLDETVLWEKSDTAANNTNFSVSLSETIAHFKKIKIYAAPNSSYLMQRPAREYIFEVVNSTTQFYYVDTHSIESNVYYGEIIYVYIDNYTTFKLSAGVRWQDTTFTKNIATYRGEILKISGIGRIASN